jgi:hypothetical protein
MLRISATTRRTHPPAKRGPSAPGKQFGVFCRIEILKQHGAHSDVVFTVYERAVNLAAMEAFAVRQADKHGIAGYRLRDLDTHEVREVWPVTEFNGRAPEKGAGILSVR